MRRWSGGDLVAIEVHRRCKQFGDAAICLICSVENQLNTEDELVMLLNKDKKG